MGDDGAEIMEKVQEQSLLALIRNPIHLSIAFGADVLKLCNRQHFALGRKLGDRLLDPEIGGREGIAHML